VQTADNSNYSGIRELASLEVGLKNYNRHIVRKLFREFSIGTLNSTTIVDFGAGLGVLAKLVEKELGVKVVCVELDDTLRQELSKRGFQAHKSLDSFKGKIDFVYSSNVFEHIEDDVTVLREIKDRLGSSGGLAVYVPALPFLFSEFDAKVGHFRRYTKRELTYKLESSGFIVEKCSYSDCIGVIAWLAVKALRLNLGVGAPSGLALRIYDTVIFPVSRFFDKLFMSRVIGKNLICFAKPKPINI